MSETPNPIKAKPETKQIIVVEDDESIMDMITMTLRAEGFHVQPARDGRGILKRTERFEPDLVVTDVMMPGAGGYEVLQTLRGNPSTKNTPVIVMSGFNFDQSTKQMLLQEPNVKAFLPKPLRTVDLVLKVHEILNTESKDERERKERMKKTGDIDWNNYNERF